MDGLQIAALIALIILITALYFLPLIIAAYRNHQNILGIGLLNLLLGWSLVGWVGALVWSVMADPIHVRYAKRMRRHR